MHAAGADWLAAVAEWTPNKGTPARFFRARQELRTSSSVERLHDEVLRILYADPAKAENLARAARWLSRMLGDSAAQGFGLRAMGHVSYARSRYQRAVKYYEQALEIFSSLGRDLEAGRTLTSGQQPLIYLGRYAEAEDWAARAREIFLRLGDHLRLARLATNTGNLLFRQDRYAQALAVYEDALATLERLGEPRDVAAALSNIAVSHISLSRFDEALRWYRAAREHCLRHDLPLLVAGADYNIAYLHSLQGDFLRAMELYAQSREHCRTLGDHYHAALCDLDESEIYLELNLNNEAADLAARAESAFQSLGMRYEGAKATVMRAVAVARRGQSSASRRLFRTARQRFRKEKNRVWPALIDLYEAVALERENRNREAAALGRRAYAVLVRSGAAGPAVLAGLLQCQLRLKENQPRRARAALARCKAQMESCGTPALRFHYYFVEGQIEEQTGCARAARASYHAARAEIETLRNRLWGDEPKISFLKDKLAIYEGLVELCLKEGTAFSAAEAFGYIQEAKSRTLSGLMSQAPASPAAPGAVSEEAENLRRRLNALYRRIERLSFSPQPARTQLEIVRESVRACERDLAGLVKPAAILETRGRAAELLFEAIQAEIPRDAVLLEYYVSRGVLLVAIVDRTGLQMVRLGAAEDIRTRMRLLRFQIRKLAMAPHAGRRERRDMLEATDAHLQDLHADLIAPFEHRLDKAGHLIFAPHDFLHQMPFHALRGAMGDVIERYSVSYSPSATVFAHCSGRNWEGPGESLVFGLADELAPHIAAEAEAVAALLPNSRLFLGEKASRKVLGELGPSCRFLHIAGHGRFRSDNPLFSGIGMGDSGLMLFDLYQLRLSAELVALSGCCTGLNVVTGGDELVGLLRGLLLAGAQGVLVSLWEVHDLSAAQFMKEFYARLPGAPHKAAALQDAIREVRKEYLHPYYWASFLLAGKYQRPGDLVL